MFQLGFFYLVIYSVESSNDKCSEWLIGCGGSKDITYYLESRFGPDRSKNRVSESSDPNNKMLDPSNLNPDILIFKSNIQIRFQNFKYIKFY